jgi:nucleoside-diphosphate-sugar epimerase
VPRSIRSDTFVAVIAAHGRGAMSDKSGALRAKSNKARGAAMTQPNGLRRRWPDSLLLVGHRATALLPPRAAIPTNGDSSEGIVTYGAGHSGPFRDTHGETFSCHACYDGRMSTYALFGASGATGATISGALEAAGLPYRVVGRDRASLERTYGTRPLAEIATWNPDDPPSVAAAAAGIDTIFYLVGVPYNHFELHPQLMRATLNGAIAAGVRRIVLLAPIYSYGRPQSASVTESHSRNPETFKGRMRKEQEDLVLDAHAAGRIEGTVLRLPDFYGGDPKKSLVGDIFVAARSKRSAMVIGPIDRPHQYAYVPDIGPLALALAREDRAYGRAWNFAGSGTITQREFAAKVFAAAGAGKPKLIVFNPLMLRIVGLFDPVMRELVDMNYLQSDPVLLDDSALRALLPNLHVTSYDDGITQVLTASRMV